MRWILYSLLGIVVAATIFAVALDVVHEPEQLVVIDKENLATEMNNIIHTNQNKITEIDLGTPLTQAKDRVTKKPFGIYITPQNSPIIPEKFSGYHTGTDFEILTGEEEAKIEIRALCDGLMRLKQSVSGYGGVFIQDCTLSDQKVTVLYGHLALSSISLSAGEQVLQGERIGVLGQGYSDETDGERKHLHVGIHKGSEINYRGYVSTEEQLSAWLNAEEYLEF